MNQTGQDARGTFPAVPDDVPPETDPLRGQREHDAVPMGRGRRRTRVLAAAGAVLAASAGGVTAALLAQSASGAPSPFAVVTSAVARTSAHSYSFSIDSTARFAGRELNFDMVTGSFDPRRQRGAELLTANGGGLRQARIQIRFAGRYVYTWVAPGSGLKSIAKPWDKAPAPPPGAEVLPELYGFSTEQPVSPGELLVVLRSGATVRDEGRAFAPGWTGTKYAFTARLSAVESVSGTVYVDQQGLVRRLVTATTQGKNFTMTRDLTFGDVGAPVPATAPPASQVEYTSKPYWGFFF
jgi:hypothetical protein